MGVLKCAILNNEMENDMEKWTSYLFFHLYVFNMFNFDVEFFSLLGDQPLFFSLLGDQPL